MFIKKLLPILVILSILFGGIPQPGYASQNLQMVSKDIQQPRADHTVCAGAGNCDFELIQEAVNNANPNDNILLADETFTESFTVDEDVNILGEGPGNTIIQAAASHRAITVTLGSVVTIESLTIQNGNTSAPGGGILNQGTLTLSNTLLTNNSAPAGGAIANIADTGQAIILVSHSTIEENSADDEGGGIYNHASQASATAILTLTHSTVANNQVQDGFKGGGVTNDGAQGSTLLVVQNSTVSNNSIESSGGGGGIHIEGGSTAASIVQSTLSTNSGGNLYVVSGSVSLAQSILAHAPGGNQDCTGTVIDGGYNLVEDGTCGLPGGDPMIEPLAENGGKTRTHALEVGSPAIDGIPAPQCASNSDQRDTARPFSLGCDIGSFELDEFDLLFEQNVNKTNVMPGQLITFTVTTTPIGTGITAGTIQGNVPAELNIQYPILLDPPEAGTVGTEPPILVSALQIQSNQTVTMTMFAELALGLPAGITLTNMIWLTSTEIIAPVLTTVTLNIINAPPIAVNDRGTGYFTTSDQPFTTANVLDNDSDPNGDELLLLGVNDSNLEGILINNSDGTFSYDPDGQFDLLPPGLTAYDTFTYTISDRKGGLSTATVTIAIQNPSNVVYLPLVTSEY